MLLAQELPNLAKLFASRPRQLLLQRTLRIVQGHPKLLELADGLAADASALAGQVAAAEREAAAGPAGRASQLDIFFAPVRGLPEGVEVGESRQEEADFVAALRGWTGGVAARLSPAAGLLLPFLCRLEEPDRRSGIVQANWGDFLKRIDSPIGDDSLESALAELATAGLVEQRTTDGGPQTANDGEATADSGAQTAGDEAAANLQSLLSSAGPEALQSLLAPLLAEMEPEQAAGLQALLADPAALLSLLQSQAADAPEPNSPFPIPNSAFHIHPGVAESVRAAADPAHLAAADKELGDFYVAMSRRAMRNEMQGGSGTVAEAARRGAPYLMRGERWEEAAKLLERLLHRDGSPTTTSFALPLLRRIVEETEGTSEGIENAGVLTGALMAAGRVDEAERTMRALIERGVAQGNYKLASTAAGNLLNLLRAAGRLEDALKLASARFNDYSPLLRLQRFDDARALLNDCRRVFEQERDIPRLGKVYSALADLSDSTVDRAGAVAFEETALRYRYQAGEPEDCAISHNNLANYLERQDAMAERVLAHRLAAATILLQTGSGQLPAVLRNLVRIGLPATPPPFAAVVAAVEAIDGVRFGWLFVRLPRRAADGDAAIAAVWGLVGEEIQRRGGEAQRRRESFESILQQIAAVAQGHDGPRQEIEALLPTLEEKGWRLSGPVARIWAGERDRASLTAGLDDQDDALVGRVLEKLAG